MHYNFCCDTIFYINKTFIRIYRLIFKALIAKVSNALFSCAGKTVFNSLYVTLHWGET